MQMISRAASDRASSRGSFVAAALPEDQARILGPALLEEQLPSAGDSDKDGYKQVGPGAQGLQIKKKGKGRCCCLEVQSVEWHDVIDLNDEHSRHNIPIVLVLMLGIIALLAYVITRRIQDFVPKKGHIIPETDYVGTAPLYRLGSFIVIGDWGYDNDIHGDIPNTTCQQAIADAMHLKMQELGDVKFIINVGDSFYPDGVKSQADEQWDKKWRNIYTPELRSIPWYSVYGNHDYHHDPCACADKASDCAQVNADYDNRDFFYMPSYAWWRSHPELNLEVIAMDLNNYQEGWNQEMKSEDFRADDCQYSYFPDGRSCEYECKDGLKKRSEESFEMLTNRTNDSPQPTFLVFSHYPTDYFRHHPYFLDQLSNASRHIEYFSGHRHNVDRSSTESTAPNNNWLVGGGGGWSCEHYEQIRQGFVVGEVGEGGSIYTYSVLIEPAKCCDMDEDDAEDDGHGGPSREYRGR